MLSFFSILFIFNSQYAKAATLPKSITTVDSPTNNQPVIQGLHIDIKGWAINTAGVKHVQVLVDGNYLIGSQYGVSGFIPSWLITKSYVTEEAIQALMEDINVRASTIKIKIMEVNLL